MITLSDPSHSIDFTCTAITTNQVEMIYAYVDSSFTGSIYAPAGNGASSAGPGPTTLISAPAAGLTRQVKYLSIANKDTVSNTFQWLFNVGGTRREIRMVTLGTLECLTWDGVTWKTYTAAGAEKVDNTSPLVTPSIFAPDSQRVGMSPLLHVLPSTGVTSGTAYWVYQGQAAAAKTIKFVEGIVHATAGTGAQTAEVCIASTPSAPNKAASQTLTKIAATGTVNALTVANTLIRNTASMAAAIVPGTHVWAGIRVAMATTQPQMIGLTADWNQGHILTTAAAGALTASATFTGSRLVMAIPYAWQAPTLRVTDD